MTNQRIGLGSDSHRFDARRPLILGGVPIANADGLAGHSDADVLTHAIIDALLGAAALGDIGSHFPPDDPTWAGADSIDLLRRTVASLRERRYRVGNVDATVIAEQPRLRPHVRRDARSFSAGARCAAGRGQCQSLHRGGDGRAGAWRGHPSPGHRPNRATGLKTGDRAGA